MTIETTRREMNLSNCFNITEFKKTDIKLYFSELRELVRGNKTAYDRANEIFSCGNISLGNATRQAAVENGINLNLYFD